MTAPLPVARVAAIRGEVFARDQDGVSRPLRSGDFIFDNESVVTGDNSAVDLSDMNGQPLNLGARETLAMDAEVLALDGTGASDSALAVSGDDFSRVIAALNEGQSLDNLLEETAAGGAASAGGEAGGGPTFVRLLRITESVDPLSYEFETVRNDVLDYPINGGQDSGSGERDPGEPGLPGGPGEPEVPGTPDPHGPPAIDLPHVGRDQPAPPGYTTFENTESSGDFTIHTEAGLDSSAALTIHGQPVSLADLSAASPSSAVRVTTPEGFLSITGYDPVTGKVSWRYEPHNPDNPGNPSSWRHDLPGHNMGDDGFIHDRFQVVVKDGDGHTAGDTMDIWIQDTAPKPSDDTAYVSSTSGAVTGNIIEGAPGGAGYDIRGGDDTWLDGVTQGNRINPTRNENFDGDVATIETGYGTLTLHRDGSYEYVLKDGVTGEHREVFTYNLRDSDGSSDLATLTIHINRSGAHGFSASLATSEAPETLLAGDLFSSDQNLHGIDSLKGESAFDVFPPVNDAVQALIEHNVDQHLIP